MTTLIPSWHTAPSEPVLAPGEVHVWRAPLTAPTAELYDQLSTEEWMRAARFHHDADRDRYITAHGLLRNILGRYLGMEPHDLQFGTNQFGKPLLRPNFTGLHFNLSHSDDLMLLALARTREVGVDVEMMRENVPFESLAEHYFAPREAWDIRICAAAERPSRFYQTWTSTEARLKAAGTGFLGDSIIQPDRWSLRTLAPADGYAGALAVEGTDFDLQCWSWQN